MTWTPQAIIFDMDGLLVDSETVWHVAETEALAQRGITYNDEARQQIIGLGMDAFTTKLVQIYNLDEPPASLREDIIARMLQLIPQRVKPQPGALELIAYVQDRALPIAIASSSAHVIINAILESQGWTQIFTVRCSGDDETASKPAPDVYLTAARRLSVRPADCLALEDSPNGARAAVAAGMTCYAVPDLSHSRLEAFADITPHIYLDLHAVLAQVQHLQNGR